MLKATPEEIEVYANMNLRAAVEDLMKTKPWEFGGSDITPEEFSAFFEENYELSLSPAEAQSWLSRQDWGETNA